MSGVEQRHFGVLIPSTNTTVEKEYTRHLPATLQFHVGRCGKGGNTPFSPSLDEDVIRQSKLLGQAKVEAIVLAQTSASLFDDDYDTRVTDWMFAQSGVPAVTSAQGIGNAIVAMGMSRIGIVTPYSDAVVENARRYYEMKFDLQIVATEGFGAVDAYSIGKLDAVIALEGLRRVDRPEIEVLVVLGGNFPTMPWIATWERAFGKPVITTNQAALWAVLGLMSLDAPLLGFGRLLEQMPR